MTRVVFLPRYPLRNVSLPAGLRPADPIEMPEVPRVGDLVEAAGGEFQAEVVQVAWVLDEELGYWWAGVHIK